MISQGQHDNRRFSLALVRAIRACKRAIKREANPLGVLTHERAVQEGGMLLAVGVDLIVESCAASGADPHRIFALLARDKLPGITLKAGTPPETPTGGGELVPVPG